MNFNIKITPTALNTLKKLKNNIGNNKDYKAVAKAICHPSTTWKWLLGKRLQGRNLNILMAKALLQRRQILIKLA